MRITVVARGALALAAALVLGACVGGGGFLGATESVVESRALDPGGAFTLENVNGRVSVTTWAEPKVKIEADKAASSGSVLGQVRIEIHGEGGRVDVRTRVPGGGLFFGGGSRVDYRVTLPAGAEVRVRTVNGRIEVTGVRGELRASTTNGAVEVREAGGPVEASTVNGSVEVRYLAFDPDGRNRLSATNGSVTAALPAGTGGRLEAQTVNGSVHSELALESTSRVSRRRLEGRLGKGSGSFEVSTVNGSIHLRKS
jgi:putative adhesin